MNKGFSSPVHKLSSPDKLLICKCETEIDTLTAFSPDKNIFNRFIEGNNLSRYLPVGLPFEEWRQGQIFHEGWDDFAPWMTDSYDTIGANHGSVFTFRVSMLRHWYFERDLGKVLTDDAGHRFIMIDIENASSFIIHSEALRDGDRIRFHEAVSGALYDNGLKLDAASITPIQMFQRNSCQLSPHYRTNSFKLFANGRELADNKITECSSALLKWDIDLCPPDALLDHLAAHPGKYISPTAPELASLLHLALEIEFMPYSIYKVHCVCRFERDFESSILWGLLQDYGTIGYEEHRKMIPGVKPFIYEPTREEIDLNHPCKVEPFSLIHNIFRDGCLHQDRLPVRYIDHFGNGGRSELGIVLEYSSNCGITAYNSPERGCKICSLPKTTKMYPYAYHADRVSKGETFEIEMTRQYFAPPEAENIESAYWRMETDHLRLYILCRGAGIVRLPVAAKLAGANFKIVESSPGLKAELLPSGEAETELAFNVSGPGEIILNCRLP